MVKLDFSTNIRAKKESLLAGFVIFLYPGNGFTEDTWNAAIKSVRISGVKTSAIINLSTGVVTATGNAGEIIPLATSEDEFEAVTIPQEVADNSKFIVINVDGIDYIYYSGYDFNKNRIIGFDNKKTNDKQPSMRIYGVDDEGKTTKEEIITLWTTTFKTSSICFSSSESILASSYTGKSQR